MRLAPTLASSLTILGLGAASGSTALAQTVQVPLNYNFNGIVHAGEAGAPDAPGGFRSISDRALDFSAGVPVHTLLAPYSLVANPGVLDIVHLGNRNTVDFGSKVFDPLPDGDNIGIQPTWLPNVDQTGAQTTVLATPLSIQAGFVTKARFLYQISNGGGSFDVTFGFQIGSPSTSQLSGPDWFGGVFAGTAAIDMGNPGANLSIVEGAVDLSAHAGRTLTSIAFSNRSNLNAGYAILAAKIDQTAPNTVFQVPLNYNFNGIVHAGEAGIPDAPAGFRSISDRALDFSAGVPAHPLLAPYSLVAAAGVLDIVHLGDRNTVDNGNWAFDPAPDGDLIGIQPTWLPNSDQTGPQTTTLATPILLNPGSSASFLYQISNGGGGFDARFHFQGGGSSVAQLSGPDWFGGVFLGTGNVDLASPDNNLSITEATVDLSAHAGQLLTAISFESATNFAGGYAILAANVSGGSGPISYCTAGTTSHGCLPSISGIGSPVAGANSGFTIAVANVEGQKQGLIFYGISGRAAVAWGTGSSFLCVKTPTQRTTVQNSGGTALACNGSLSLDFLAFIAAHPSALGAPFAPGDVVNAQGWFRDPPAPKTTNLSNGLEFTMQ
jgi:hypothetical protein